MYVGTDRSICCCNNGLAVEPVVSCYTNACDVAPSGESVRFRQVSRGWGCSDCPAGFFMSHTSHYLVRCDICGAGKVLTSCCFNLASTVRRDISQTRIARGNALPVLWVTTSQMRKSTRKACDTGKHTDQTAQPQCKNCAVGTYLNEMGQSTCKVCAVGKCKMKKAKVFARTAFSWSLHHARAE